jgi:hypothetical protein
MEMTKAHWTSDGDNYRMDMALTKVDKENRLVTGWASLDNPDLQGDIVLAEASERAFAKFRGNIREMHQPIAVGRMVSYRPDSYYDTETQKFYNGIVVTAYVSKGAESTWEKVLDGTLQAFSISGPIIESEMEFSKDAGRPLRIIKDYELVELSLVDSGGNQLANIISIQKDVNGDVTASGMAVETTTENVFWCAKHESGIAKTSTEDSAVCPDGHTMQNIGWFETDGSDKAEKVQKVIDSHLTTTGSANAEIAKQEEPANNQGGVNVAEENANSEAEAEVDAGATVPVVDESTEQGKSESDADASVEAVAEADEENVVEESEVSAVEESADEESDEEKAADVSEVEGDEPDFAKMFGDLQGAIESGLEKNAKAATDAIAEAKAAFEARVDELVKSHSELVEKFNGIKTELEGVEKSLAAVESDTAVRKSGDLGGSKETTVTKSNRGWGGAFLGHSDAE